MSATEIKEKLHAIIDRHGDNEAWLARIFEILEQAAPDQDKNWWAMLTDEQKKRIDDSVRSSEAGELISHDDVLNSL